MIERSRARGELIVAALLFSTGGAAVKAVDFSAVQVAGFRSGIAALAMLLLLPAARRGWSWRVAVVALAYAATLVLFVLANRLTTAANTIFLQATAPLYLLVLGPLLLKEPIRRQDLVFMLAVAAGMVTFFVGSEAPVATAPDPSRGNMLAALSGVTWALTICGLRWLGSAEEHARPGRGSGALAAVVCGNLFAFLACAPLSFPVGTHGIDDWALLVFLGVFQIALAYVFVTRALRWLAAFEASLLLLIEPALNPLWAWLVHAERPSIWAVMGGTVIVGATVLKTWRDTRGAATRVQAVEPERP